MPHTSGHDLKQELNIISEDSNSENNSSDTGSMTDEIGDEFDSEETKEKERLRKNTNPNGTDMKRIITDAKKTFTAGLNSVTSGAGLDNFYIGDK